ncbi:MAG: hypothetical protein JEZ08_03000 [Clostridiales bacterium]|nr:hypothetical protein [Clostridiales bacterium]
MKRLLVLMMTVILLMGCEIDALNYYQEAIEKTDTIETAKSKMELNFSLDFSEEAIAEVPDLVDLLSEMTYIDDSKFDKIEEKIISRQYFGTKAFGVDTIYYKNADRSFIKVPFSGKFLKFDVENMIEGLDMSVYDEPPISGQTFQMIKEKWFSLVHEEDVVNLGDEVIDTPEGEVKVKKMVVTFSNEQIHGFLDDVLELMSNDSIFEEKLKSYPTYAFEDGEFTVVDDYEMDMKESIELIGMLLDDLIVDEFKFITYIDIDKYVIHHKYEIDLSFKGDLETVIESINMTSDYQLYDIHEKNMFEMPVLTEKNTITITELLEDLEFEIPLEE